MIFESGMIAPALIINRRADVFQLPPCSEICLSVRHPLTLSAHYSPSTACRVVQDIVVASMPYMAVHIVVCALAEVLRGVISGCGRQVCSKGEGWVKGRKGDPK